MSKGEKYDEEKPDWSLLPANAAQEAVKVLTFGAKKYSDENWRLLDNAKKRYIAAALRHISEYRLGKILDDETGLHHLAHAVCCLFFIAELDIQKENLNTNATP